MNQQRLSEAITASSEELINYVAKYNAGILEPAEKRAKEVLDLLTTELVPPKTIINERVLRAYWDISVYSLRNYWDVKLGEALKNLTKVLYEEIPDFKYLKPLGMDFGKGMPI